MYVFLKNDKEKTTTTLENLTQNILHYQVHSAYFFRYQHLKHIVFQSFHLH